MRQSFRLKIGLLSMGLSGLLLLGFGLFAVSVLNRVGLERIDRELRALSDAQVRKIQPAGHWRVFDDSLRSLYGEDASRQFAVKATQATGERLYASADWPPDLPDAALPLPLPSAPENRELEPPLLHDGPPAEERANPAPRPFDEPPPRRAPPRRMVVTGPVYATFHGPTASWRALTLANENVTLSLAMNLSGLEAETRHFQRALLVTVPLGLLLLVAGSWLTGHLALRPINRIARTVDSITAHRLNERISSENADEEFKRLIVLINGMLERLEKSFQQATRFSADAAHELKTPLAILQAQIERSLQRAADGSDEQRDYAGQLDEVQRLKAILRKLLLLSQADSGHLPLSLEHFNLADPVRAIADDVQMLAPSRKTTIEAPRELTVIGDADLLNQAIENLVSNAIKFGDSEGTITLTLNTQNDRAVLTVSNSGTPIREQDQDKIFDRFYRADSSHSRDIEGSGLGLSLAREIARAHGGDLHLVRSDTQSTSFALSIPLPTPGSAPASAQ